MELLSTELDVWQKAKQLYEDKEDETPARRFPEIQAVIAETDGDLRNRLRQAYGSVLTTDITPWCKKPIASDNNNSASGSYKGYPTIASDAVTELYIITFTGTAGAASTAFSFEGTITGSDGTGATGSDSASTGGNITMLTADWSGAFKTGDIFYVSVYANEAGLVNVSAKLAASMMLKAVFTEEVPNTTPYCDKLYNEAQAQIDRWVDMTNPEELEIGLAARDIDPIQRKYDINEFGEDKTPYSPDQY